MIRKNTKGYINDKIKRNYDLYSFYFDNTSGYLFSPQDRYMIKNNILYEGTIKRKFLTKQGVIDEFGKEYFYNIENNIKYFFLNKYNSNFYHGLFLNTYSNNNFIYKDIRTVDNEVIVKNIKNLIKKGKIDIYYIKNKKGKKDTITFSSIFDNYENFLEVLEKYFGNEKIIKNIIGHLGYYGQISYNLEKLIKYKINEKLKLFYNKVTLKVNNITAYEIYNNLGNNILYRINQEYIFVDKVFRNKTQNNFFISLLGKNYKNGVIYKGNELRKLINKNKILEKKIDLQKFRLDVPSWYKKMENKSFRTKDKQKIRNAIAHGNYEQMYLSKWQKTASYYY